MRWSGAARQASLIQAMAGRCRGIPGNRRAGRRTRAVATRPVAGAAQPTRDPRRPPGSPADSEHIKYVLAYYL
jgi:hypothetical protein